MRRLDERSEEVSSGPLEVVTGLPTDGVRTVPPDHAAYDRLTLALSSQDAWTIDEHAGFWSALLPALPRSGRPASRELLSVAAAALRSAHRLTPVEVADVLGVAPGTVREGQQDGFGRDGYPTSDRRQRPSFELGEKIMQRNVADAEDYAEAVRWACGSTWDGFYAYPRVYVAGESDEDGTSRPEGHLRRRRLNPRLDTSWWRPAGVEYLDAARREHDNRRQSAA